jgi:hypothetical protein
MATIRRMRAHDRVKSGPAALSLGFVTMPANPAAGGTIYRLYPKADFKNIKVFQVFRFGANFALALSAEERGIHDYGNGQRSKLSSSRVDLHLG